MRKQLTPYFKFNTSTNPFAYIRNEKDINHFIDALKQISQSEQYEPKFNKKHLQLIWLAATFLTTCQFGERNIKNLIKIIKTTESENEISPFEIIINDLKDKSLKDKLEYFKCKVCGTNSNTCKKIITQCTTLLKSIPSKEIVRMMGYSEDFPYQGTLYQGRKKYDIWFEPGKTFEINNAYKKEETFYQITLPELFYDKNQKEIINIAFSFPDYTLKALLQNKASEILFIIKEKKIKPQSIINSKQNAEESDNLFDDINIDEGQTKQRNISCRYQTAIHEAGHTVATYLLNLEYEGVSIKPTKSSLGRVEIMNTPSKTEDAAVICFAGYLSEQILFNNNFLYINSASTDIKHSTQRIKKDILAKCKEENKEQEYIFIDTDVLGLNDNESPYVIYETIKKCIECHEKAKKLISENINLVEALANKLLKKETISSEEVNDFLDSLRAEMNKE